MNINFFNSNFQLLKLQFSSAIFIYLFFCTSPWNQEWTFHPTGTAETPDEKYEKDCFQTLDNKQCKTLISERWKENKGKPMTVLARPRLKALSSLWCREEELKQRPAACQRDWCIEKPIIRIGVHLSLWPIIKAGMQDELHEVRQRRGSTSWTIPRMLGNIGVLTRKVLLAEKQAINSSETPEDSHLNGRGKDALE